MAQSGSVSETPRDLTEEECEAIVDILVLFKRFWNCHPGIAAERTCARNLVSAVVKTIWNLPIN